MAWNISEAAARLHRDAVVCDVTLPWGPYENKEATLPRFADAGVSFLSLTVGNDFRSLESTIFLIANERRRFVTAPEKFLLVETVDDILRAKREGKLGIGFHSRAQTRSRATWRWSRSSTSSASATPSSPTTRRTSSLTAATSAPMRDSPVSASG